MLLMNNYTKKPGSQSEVKNRRPSVAGTKVDQPAAIGMTVGTVTYDDQAIKGAVVNTSAIENILKIKGEVRNELKKIEQLDFNIFYVEHETMGNELVTVASYILAKEGIFAKL
jgi:hypothetical protein